MFAFVARQPILDKNKDVFAYELSFRDGKAGAYPELPPEKAKYVAEHFYTLGLDDISGEKTSFINFSNDTLIQRFPTSLDPATVIVEVTDNPLSQKSLLEACRHIKNLGFKIAVNNPVILNGQHDMYPLIDIVKVDITKVSLEQVERHVQRLADNRVKLVAEQVNNYSDFNDCRSIGFDFFQGYFFSTPEARAKRELPSSKMNLANLMGECAKPEFNFDVVNEIIERDATLSYMLLKFVNNPSINKRFKISSLRHALNFMGEVEVKKFIALLSVANLSDDKPIELVHLSLVRAKFFDLLSHERKIVANPPISFIIGLFSLLDALLDQSMPDILAQLPLVDEVKDALLGKSSEFNHYLKLVKAFESGIWMNVIQQSKVLEVDQKHLHSLFNEAIVWGNSVRSSISNHYPRASVSA